VIEVVNATPNNSSDVAGGKRLSDHRLALELASEDRPRDLIAHGGAKSNGLSATEGRFIQAAAGRRHEELTLRVNRNQRNSGVRHPSKSVQRHVSRVAQDDEATKAARGTTESRSSSTVADSVCNEQLASVDSELNAIAIDDTDSRSTDGDRGRRMVDVHGGVPPLWQPRDRANGCRGVVVG
jgi:hypothetical protein